MAFDYYGNVHRVLFDINHNKELLDSCIRERQHLIDVSGPPAYRAISYDEPRIQSSSKKLSDEQIINRISELTTLIFHYEIIITEKKETLNKLRNLGRKALQKIESRGKEDLKLKVFMLAYIDGKSNEEIMDEVPGYEIKTIWNIKSEFNTMFKDNIFAMKLGSNSGVSIY